MKSSQKLHTLSIITLLFSSNINANKIPTAIAQVAQAATKKVNLVMPNLSDSQIIGKTTGLRPYRTSGIRIEAQKLANDRLLIHNYGHGGAGLSLSWGSSDEAVKAMEKSLAEQNIAGPQNVAVIGAGVAGLTTAHRLRNKGHKVHVYAQLYPPHTTSNIAAGVYSPFSVAVGDSEEQKQQFERMKAVSYAALHELATSSNPEFQGVHILDLYDFSQNAAGQPVEVEFDNGVKKNGTVKPTLFMEGCTYIQHLYEKLLEKGVERTYRTFYYADQLERLPERIVVNCTGLGARDLFDDQELKPIRGQLLYLKPQEGVNYLATEKTEGKKVFFSLYPWHDRLIVGGTLEPEKEEYHADNKTRQEMLDNARQALRDDERK